MILYYVRLALLSLRRNWLLSTVMVVCLSVGIASWVMAQAAIHGATRNPLPHRPGLHLVMVDRKPFYVDVVPLEQSNYPLERAGRVLLSYTEYRAIATSRAPSAQTPTTVAELVISSDRQAPFVDDVRFAGSRFFGMFDLPFVRGGTFPARADTDPDSVAVITQAMGRRLFGEVDPIGLGFQVAGRRFTVCGVLADALPAKIYDVIFLRREPEEIILPFTNFAPMRIRPIQPFGQGSAVSSYEEFLSGESLWIKLWVDLPDLAAKRAFLADLASSGVGGAYVITATESRPQLAFLHAGYYILELFAYGMLIATIFNLVRLLLAKFTARVDQTGIHRALGASRRTIVVVHIAEATIIGLAGGVLGLVLGKITMTIFDTLIPDRAADAVLEWGGALITLVVSVSIGMLAGAYPAWRATRIAPAVFLKRQ
jgi:putative ABC transport system permease protein